MRRLPRDPGGTVLQGGGHRADHPAAGPDHPATPAHDRLPVDLAPGQGALPLLPRGRRAVPRAGEGPGPERRRRCAAAGRPAGGWPDGVRHAHRGIRPGLPPALHHRVPGTAHVHGRLPAQQRGPAARCRRERRGRAGLPVPPAEGRP